MPASVLWTRFSRVTRGALGCSLLIVLLAMFLETYLVYPAPPKSEGTWDAASFEAEDFDVTSADGTKINAWYFPHSDARGTLIYFHGNGEHLGFLGKRMSNLRDSLRLSILAFDYRGYGRSGGSPSESGILRDARAIHDWLLQRTGSRADEVLLFGRSLGGGVAVDLAAERGARGLILWNTFGALPDAGAKIFPWLPVRWLMRNQYDSASKISRYTGPLLQTHGTADELVPLASGERLFAAAVSPDKQFIPVPDGGHNGPAAWEFELALEQFIDRICGP